jgi:hypothetical protein
MIEWQNWLTAFCFGVSEDELHHLLEMLVKHSLIHGFV